MQHLTTITYKLSSNSKLHNFSNLTASFLRVPEVHKNPSSQTNALNKYKQTPKEAKNKTSEGSSSRKMQKLGEFKLPNFLNYPPYFTLQPVRETREKQIQLWKELIIDFCRTQKVFVIGLEEDFPLFSNPAIESECFLLLVFYMSDVQLRSCVIYITLTIAFAKMNSRCLEIHNASDLEHQWNVKYQFM